MYQVGFEFEGTILLVKVIKPRKAPSRIATSITINSLGNGYGKKQTISKTLAEKNGTITKPLKATKEKFFNKKSIMHPEQEKKRKELSTKKVETAAKPPTKPDAKTTAKAPAKAAKAAVKETKAKAITKEVLVKASTESVAPLAPLAPTKRGRKKTVVPEPEVEEEEELPEQEIVEEDGAFGGEDEYGSDAVED